MCRVDHNPLGFRPFTSQGCEDAVKYTQPSPSDEPIIEGLVWFIFLWRIFLLKSVSDHIDDATDNPPIINTWNAMRQEKNGEIRDICFSLSKNKPLMKASENQVAF